MERMRQRLICRVTRGAYTANFNHISVLQFLANAYLELRVRRMLEARHEEEPVTFRRVDDLAKFEVRK